MKYFAKKVEYQDHVFDSSWERDYFIELQNNPAVEEITLQPEYEIIPMYEVECYRCKGVGRRRNERTGRMNKCTLCDGEGLRTKRGSKKKSDFYPLFNPFLTKSLIASLLFFNLLSCQYCSISSTISLENVTKICVFFSLSIAISSSPLIAL